MKTLIGIYLTFLKMGGSDIRRGLYNAAHLAAGGG